MLETEEFDQKISLIKEIVDTKGGFVDNVRVLQEKYPDLLNQEIQENIASKSTHHVDTKALRLKLKQFLGH